MKHILFCIFLMGSTISISASSMDDKHFDGKGNLRMTSNVSENASEDEATALETFSDFDAEAELEQVNFTPSKHRKERQKSKGSGDRTKEVTHRTHKEGEDLEMASLKEQPLEAPEHKVNTHAISILHNTSIPQHIQAEDISQKVEASLSQPENMRMG